MRKKFIRSLVVAACISACAAPVVNAQEAANVEPHGFSLGGTFGLSDLWGDVGTQSVVDHYTNNKYWDKPHFMGGIFFRYSFHPALAARLNFNYGTVFATDEWNTEKAKLATSLADDYVQRYARGQTSKADILESALTFEFSPFRLGSPIGKAAQRAGQLYFLAGIGYFHFTPYSMYTNRESKVSQWVETYNLHLEGDGFPEAGAPSSYSLWQLEIPLGVGYKFDIGEHLNIGIEYQWRMTQTDYLDGVSDKYIDPKLFDQHLSAINAAVAKDLYDRAWVPGVIKTGNPPGNLRGNSSDMDSYSTISFVLYWKLKNKQGNWWQ
ncbi:MAG: outer membrane beta-barrel protein [Taibaiella sp.]|nr:outer membrane beta-barrel protein [Taibaiella sp.]